MCGQESSDCATKNTGTVSTPPQPAQSGYLSVFICVYLHLLTPLALAYWIRKEQKKKEKKKVKRFEAAVTHSTGGNQHSASFGFPCLKPKLTMNYDPCRLHFVRRSGSCRFSIYARRLYALQLSSRREQLSP